MFFALIASQLTIYAELNPETPLFQTKEPQEIAQSLSDIGVRFEQWNADQILASDTDVIALYQEQVELLKKENGYATVDVVRMQPDHPDKEALRTKFLNEHSHTEDEVRFFVEGAGQFYLHVNDKVYITLC